MYNVVIVDDETAVLDCLREAIDWESYNISHVLTFDDSVAALEYIKSNNTDIIITDIKMARMDGLELIKEIRQAGKQSVVIIISAYSDFTYAQQAIKFNAFDYILKPIDFEKLKTALDKASIHLSAAHIHGSPDYEYEMLNRQEIISKFFSSLTTDSKELTEMICCQLPEYDYNLSPCAIVSTYISGFADFLKSKWKYSMDSFYNFLSRTFIADCIVFFPISFSFGLVCFFAVGKDNSFKSELDRVLCDISVQLGDTIGNSAEISVLRHYQNTEEAKKTVKYIVNLPKTTDKSSTPCDSISKAIEYIAANYTNDISLHEIAKHLNYSPCYFSKYFKRETGDNFSEYLNRVRIEKSKDFVEHSNKTIADICKLVGYNSKNHFYKMFKLYYGCTPQEYRNTLAKGTSKENSDVCN